MSFPTDSDGIFLWDSNGHTAEPKKWDGKELIPKNAKSILKMDYYIADVADKSANRGSTTLWLV